jgi:PAS domain S-box-containing protein
MSAQPPATILFVDDDATGRGLTAQFLREAGFTVWEASTGQEGLRRAEARPDLVLLDVSLPDLSGFEVCRALKANPATASLPVMHLSGAAATSLDKTVGLKGGADGYLTKPIDPDELIAHVVALLRMHRAEEAARRSEERLRLIIDTAYDAFLATDEEGRLIDWNRQAERTFGWSRAEALGRPLAELIIAGHARARHERGMAELCRTGGSPVLNTLLEVTALHKNGREFPAEVMISVVDWGGTSLLSAFVRDVSERKRAERQQAVQHGVSQALVEAGSLGEATRRILQVVCELTGWDAGVVWRVDPQGPALRCIETWSAPGVDAHEFEALTRRLSLAPGEGLPGCVWASRAPASVLNFADQPDRRRSRAAARVGLHAAVGIPVPFGQEVTGVIEFFSRSARPPDELLAILGTPTGQIGQFLERKRAEEAQAERAALAAFGADVAVTLTRAASLREMLQRCAEAMVRHLGAALARIWTLEATAGVLELQASAGVYTHRDGTDARVALGQSQIGRIALERRSILTNDAPRDPRIWDRDWARREGMVAFAGHPLQLGGELVGILALFARQPLSAFAQQALASAADNIAAGIHRKLAERALRATEEEFRTARRIQEHLFPRRAPAVPGFDIGGRSYPAEATGGDYYDYVPLCDGTLGVAIGDASGHGLGPALLMASTRASLHALALVHADVCEILSVVNRLLSENTEDEFVTLFLARFDPARGAFVYASAGHHPGYHLDRHGRVKARLASTGMPLGVLADSPFPCSAPVVMEPGDLILLLTDGVTEACAPDKTYFGAERALAITHHYRHDPSAQIVANLYSAVRAFTHGAPQLDDITALVIKRDGAVPMGQRRG